MSDNIQKNEKTFTESFSDLEKAATEISKRTITLEESLKIFEQGMMEAEHCMSILNNAEQKIKIYEEGKPDENV